MNENEKRGIKLEPWQVEATIAVFEEGISENEKRELRRNAEGCDIYFVIRRCDLYPSLTSV